MKTIKIAGIVLAVVFSFVALGQNPPAVGSIAGTVRDSAGAVIPGVTITAVGPGGAARSITNEQGAFVISNLQVGSYNVSAVLQGFQGEGYSVTVSAGGSARAEFTMQIAPRQIPPLSPPMPYQGTPNPNIRADRQTRLGSSIRYRGNVVMITNGLELRADELDYDINSGTGDVRGNVTFRMVPGGARVIPLAKGAFH